VVPASPKTAFILAGVGFVSLALQIGIVLFGELMSGRAVYDRRTLASNALHDHEPLLDEQDQPFAAAEATELEPDLFAGAQQPTAAAYDEAPVPAAEMVRTMAPQLEPTAAPRPRYSAVAEAELGLSNLSADIALGRARVVLLAGIAEARDAALIADDLVSRALANGLSVCRVDAGSNRASSALGLTDLCADQAGYGDIVHKVRDGLAEVPWGTLPVLDRRSSKPLTLIEALADIYEVVVVSTGRIGLSSSLPLFAGTRARVALVRQPGTPDAMVDAATADAVSLGFEAASAVMASEPETAVA
jgi:hypothetical protein